MPISNEGMLGIAERMEEIESRSLVMYDALALCLRDAKQGLLPGAGAEQTTAAMLRNIRDRILATQKLLDDTNRAQFKKPSFALDLEDDEALELAETFGFHALKPEQQLRVISARKRKSVRESKSLAEHGRDLLKLVHAEHAITDPHPHGDSTE